MQKGFIRKVVLDSFRLFYDVLMQTSLKTVSYVEGEVVEGVLGSRLVEDLKFWCSLILNGLKNM
jgi:hypothetical protein